MDMQQLWKRYGARWPWVYVIAAIPAVLAALYGAEAGAFVPYALIAGAIAACCFYPTPIAWWVIFAVYFVATVWSVCALVRDLLRLTANQTPSILKDTSDSTGFAIWIALLAVVTLLLWVIRPWRKTAALSVR